jgi:hypothetical protein
MSSNPTNTEESQSAAKCCEGQFQEWYARAENCAKKEPLKSAAIAFLCGMILTVLPVGRILGALVRLAFALIRPVLVVLGAMKVLEEIEKRRGE